MALVSAQLVAELERQGQARHQALGITGLLLYLNGSTLHLLEGLKEQVLNEYDIIQYNLRHNYVILLYQRETTHQLFR